MTPERWARIKQVFGAAREIAPGERPAFLDNACGSDEPLRLEVERLLAEPQDSWLKNPAEDGTMPEFSTGQVLGRYRIESKLGQGGMGAVYKAHDTVLRRTVAVKVLPAWRLTDPETKQRLMREARAASALNHPNIVTIHDIDQADGIDFIAMEYLPGKTLDQVIPRKGLRISEALKYAVQVADALAAAHAAGIVHRDIKPSNIVVSDDGQVKVLDFGLAKRVGAAPGEASTATAQGVIAGTAAYMSPEQAEGKAVDARTDVFSFGVLLYEMLSGRRAFAGTSVQATLAAVIRDEPPPIAQIPGGLEKLLARCLRKDPARRAQHISDVKLELEQLKEESESGVSGNKLAVTPAPAMRRWILLSLAALTLLAATIVFRQMRSVPALPEPEMKSVVLTAYPGVQRDPALSPDGKQIAFSWNGDKEDNLDIYVKLVDAGTPVRVTQNPAVDVLPAWSPDGRFLAFVRYSSGQGGYYVIPALGGPERKVADIPLFPSHRPAPSADWTPDAKSLVIVDTSMNTPSLAQVSVADGMKRRLTTPPATSFGDYHPAVSPDGKWLAFDRVASVSVHNLHAVPLSEAASSPTSSAVIHTRDVILSRPTWTSDSRQLVFEETATSMVGESRLVRAPVPGPGKAESIPAAGTGAGSPSIAHQGGRFAYVHSFIDTNLWRADLRDPKAPAVRLIASARVEYQPDYSSDGTKIAFISSRSGADEVWTANADGSNLVQITTQAAKPTAPRWSPDGRQIAFAQRPGGNVDVYVVDSQGGEPRRMTTDPANDASAYWSRDGKWIYFASNRTGRQEVWKMPADSSAREVQVTHDGGWRSRESFDGQTLYFQKFDLTGLFRMPVGGGTEERIAEVQSLHDWQLTPDAIYQMRFTGGRCMIDRLDLKTGRTTEALKLPPGTWGGTNNFALSPDGRWLVFVHLDQSSTELMMIENFR